MMLCSNLLQLFGDPKAANGGGTEHTTYSEQEHLVEALFNDFLLV